MKGDRRRHAEEGPGCAGTGAQALRANFDASVAGLGGCPYAKGATGNVLFLLQGLGIETGISLDGVIDAATCISGVLGRKPVSRSANALMAKRVAASLSS